MTTHRWISATLPGTPPSVNKLPLNPANPQYRRIRDAWIRDIAYTFSEAGNRLPRGLTRVRAHAVLGFKTNRRRDSGNYKALLDKWLGDCMQHAGIIADDTHDIYNFGEVVIIVDPTAPESHFIVIEYEQEN